MVVGHTYIRYSALHYSALLCSTPPFTMLRYTSLLYAPQTLMEEVIRTHHTLHCTYTALDYISLDYTFLHAADVNGRGHPHTPGLANRLGQRLRLIDRYGVRRGGLPLKRKPVRA